MKGAVKATLDRVGFEKVGFDMKCFGASGRYSEMKYPRAQEEPFLKAAVSEITGTYGFAVVDTVTLRHRRNLFTCDIGAALDAIAKKLADQDLDEWFTNLQEPAICLPKKKRRIVEDFSFEADEFFVTRPVPTPPPVA
ncbi:unnamed protein product [Symbiodinium sp. CCMP2592]|nr:unnamed protein product [Symbiodinium sp. CCMP2592]